MLKEILKELSEESSSYLSGNKDDYEIKGAVIFLRHGDPEEIMEKIIKLGIKKKNIETGDRRVIVDSGSGSLTKKEIKILKSLSYGEVKSLDPYIYKVDIFNF